jgi:hypothetical protein
MMEKIKNYIQDQKLKRSMQREFSPSRKSQNKARLSFMHIVREELGLSSKTSSIAWGRYSMAAIALFLLLNGGMAVYADTQDVAPNHVLYSFKRLSEEVQLATAAPDTKAELEVKFAERRAKELKILMKSDDETATSTVSVNATTTLRVRNPEIKKKLRENLERNIQSLEESIKKVPAAQLKTKTDIICKNINSFESDVSIVFNDASSSAKVLSNISKICAKKTEQQIKRDEKQDTRENKENRSNQQNMQQNNAPRVYNRAETIINSKSEKKIEIDENIRTNESTEVKTNISLP